MKGAAIIDGLRVIDGGVLTTIQDAGRSGVAAMGVSPAGWADWLSARAANRLVANDENAALIEVTMARAEFELLCDTRLAVTGADTALEIAGHSVSGWRAYEVRAGRRIKIGGAEGGLRSYLAVGGGICVPCVFGSASTDVGAGFGGFAGRPLKSGDVLRITAPENVAVGLGPTVAGIYSREPISRDACRNYLHAQINGREDVAKSTTTILRALLGPNADGRIAKDLVNRTYRVSHQSNRQALRLEGEAIPLARPPEIISAGVCAGCVQLTSDGFPIVLLAEHQTTGGYPTVLCVCTADLPYAAQLPPGSTVRFRLVTYVEASLALREVMTALSPGVHAGINSRDYIEEV